jgi:hypothetical protein
VLEVLEIFAKKLHDPDANAKHLMRTRTRNGVAPAASLTDEDMLAHLMEQFRQRMLSSAVLFGLQGHWDPDTSQNDRRADEKVNRLCYRTLDSHFIFVTCLEGGQGH